MTTYPPTPGPPEPEPPEPERRGETEEGGTPFSGNQPGPEPPEKPPGATPGETPVAPADEPQSGWPPAPPPPGTSPNAPPPAGGGYSPYAGGSVPPPPPPPSAYNADGPLTGPRNGLGIAALICGILAVALSFLPFALALGVLAIVFGAIGWNRAIKGQATNKPLAIAGLVLGIVSFVAFCLIYIVIGMEGAGTNYGAPM